MGKLDAICAKLKQINYVDQDGTELVEEYNNNNDKLLTNGLNKDAFVLKNLENETASSRRKKRKTATPRNLSQVRGYLEQFDDKDDELADYEINNQHTDFPPDDHTSRNLCVHLQFEEISANVLPEISPITPDDKEQLEYNGKHVIAEESSPLDLSVVRTSGNDICDVGEEDEGVGTNGCMTPDIDPGVKKVSQTAASTNKVPSKPTEVLNETRETNVLKDYAETTMNELLQMYGFEGKSETVTKQVPLQNFSTKQILQTKLQNNLKARSPHLKTCEDTVLTGMPTSIKAKALNSKFVNNTKPPDVAEGKFTKI